MKATIIKSHKRTNPHTGKQYKVPEHQRVKKRKYKARIKSAPANKQFLERVFHMQLKAKRIDKDLLAETVKLLAAA